MNGALCWLGRVARTLAAALGVAFVIAMVAFVVLAGNAHAQAASAPPPEPYCLPGTALLKGTGTDFALFETADVSGRVGWCKSNNGGWRIVIHQWNLRKAAPIPFDVYVGDAITRVLRSSDPIAQAKIEWATYGVPLETDLDRWLYRDWRYQACQWLTSTTPGAMNPRPPLPIAWPNSPPLNADGTPWLPPPGYCDPWTPGAKPVPAPSTWKAVGGAIYRHAAGKLLGVVSGKTAAKDAPCTGITVSQAGTFIYQQLVGGPADEATRCIKP